MKLPLAAFPMATKAQSDLAMLDPVETINARLAGANIQTVYEVMQNAPEAIGVLDSSEYDSVDDLVGTTVGLVSDRDRAFLQASLDVVGARAVLQSDDHAAEVRERQQAEGGHEQHDHGDGGGDRTDVGDH